jgi:hypothetical protein
LDEVKKGIIRIIPILLVWSALLGSFPVMAEYTCGVKSGDWIKYNINISYVGQSVAGSMKITIQNVQGTHINGTIETSVQEIFGTVTENISIDIATGTGTYAGFIIPANLTVGNPIPGESANVQSIVTKNGRNAIATNATSPYGGFSGQVYWDQASGVFLESSGSAVGTSFSITLAETSLWGGGFLFDWWIWMIIIVIVVGVAAATVLMLRRRKPAAVRRLIQEQPPPPPPPPPA